MTKGQKNLQILFLAAVAIIMLFVWPHLGLSAEASPAARAADEFLSPGDITAPPAMPASRTGNLPRPALETDRETASNV